MDDKEQRKLQRLGAIKADKHSKRTGLPTTALVETSLDGRPRVAYSIKTPSGATVVLRAASSEGRLLSEYPQREIRTRLSREAEHAKRTEATRTTEQLGDAPGEGPEV